MWTATSWKSSDSICQLYRNVSAYRITCTVCGRCHSFWPTFSIRPLKTTHMPHAPDVWCHISLIQIFIFPPVTHLAVSPVYFWKMYRQISWTLTRRGWHNGTVCLTLPLICLCLYDNIVIKIRLSLENKWRRSTVHSLQNPFSCMTVIHLGGRITVIRPPRWMTVIFYLF